METGLSQLTTAAVSPTLGGLVDANLSLPARPIQTHAISPWYDPNSTISAVAALPNQRGSAGDPDCKSIRAPCSNPELNYSKFLLGRLPHMVRDQLDPVSDIAGYVALWSAPYRQHIETLAAQIGPIGSDCLASVCIPVADVEEHNFIYDTLRSFAKQEVAAQNFEIVLFANYHSSYASSWSIEKSPSYQALERARVELPNLNIRVCNARFDGEPKPTIGLIRGIVNDVVVYRQFLSDKGCDHILIQADADTRGVSPNYIRGFINRLDRNPQVDSIWCQPRWSPEQLRNRPLEFFEAMLYDRVILTLRVYGHRNYFGGPALAIRASIYAQLGGHSPLHSFAEDYSLSRKLAYSRRADSPRIAFSYGGSSRLFTSPRRALLARQGGASFLAQWDPNGEPFSLSNPHVRYGYSIEERDLPDSDDVFLRLINRRLASAVVFANTIDPNLFQRPEVVTKMVSDYFGLKCHVGEYGRPQVTESVGICERINSLCERYYQLWVNRTAGVLL